MSHFIFNSYEIFSDFICENNIGSLVNSSFAVEIFNPFSSFTFSFSPSRGDMGDTFPPPSCGDPNQSLYSVPSKNAPPILYIKENLFFFYI